MSPVLLVCLGFPALLGLLVILRILRNVGKLVIQGRRAKRGSQNIPVPLLDQPTPCPSCSRLDLVAVSRADFREMPYVEHFICRACGTQYLGPNQEAMVAKRLEAKRKIEAQLAGRKLTAVSSAELKKKP